MIGPNPTGAATTLVIVDLVLFLLSFPFIVCDFYYANRDYSCVWAPIERFNIKVPLQRWMRVDGAMMLVFIIIMLIISITICMSPGCDWMYPVHAVIGGILAIFRFCWLIVGAVLFWGYLNKYHYCASNVRGFMFANLIIGFLLLPLFFIAAFMYPCAPVPAMNTAVPIPVAAPTYRGTSTALY